jgi:hypothetical protein
VTIDCTLSGRSISCCAGITTAAVARSRWRWIWVSSGITSTMTSTLRGTTAGTGLGSME